MLRPWLWIWQRTSSSSPWQMRSGASCTRRACRASSFVHWFDNRQVGLVIMEACGSAHHWARVLQARGIQVRMLPPRYVRAYVKRNKTDAADAAALLEAARCADIIPVRVKSVEQQCLQAMHRVRSRMDGDPHRTHQRAARPVS